MTGRGRWIVAAALGLGAVAAFVARSGRGIRGVPGKADPSHAARPVVPAGTRITVEVLNATDTRGLARSAAEFLRDAGFDVVYFGNTAERRDSTLIRDRMGHPDWSAMAQRVMAPAAVESSPDSTRLVDLTVLVGALWRPPPDPLRP
ncbi:MAG TPA: LytR C-terminal domain-containing protein [Gemmatimonadaceae bacterium]|nr:LytR C-terminal domain-containing protein [Gemmatimonadaceae bacterium]